MHFIINEIEVHSDRIDIMVFKSLNVLGPESSVGSQSLKKGSICDTSTKQVVMP